MISEVPAGSPRVSTYGVEESVADAVVLLPGRLAEHHGLPCEKR